jgi:predicted RNase H-like nuclease (RuvC/YqgF family)
MGTRITDSTLIELEGNIAELSEEKAKLTFRRKELDLEIAPLNNKFKKNVFLSDNEYDLVLSKQLKIKREMLQVDKSISEINSQLRKKNLLKEQLKHELKTTDKLDVKTKLINFRNEYMAFAADRSRISSMRAMASEIAEKIESILKTI